MPRVKTGPAKRRRHNKVLAMTRGQHASRHLLYKRAHEALLKSLSYAFAHRRERKGDMRRLWIQRVTAASRAEGMKYSEFMSGLRKAGVIINRKVLAEMAVREPAAFTNLVTIARGQPQD